MAEQHHTGNRGNFAEDREKASRAGHVGGQRSSGTFANDRERAAEAGRKGGKRSLGGGGAERNPGTFAQDRERTAGAGGKGRSALTVRNKPEGPVEQRINSARDSLPGRRNGLPEGALTRPTAEPQGDENRDPPPNRPYRSDVGAEDGRRGTGDA